MPSEIVNLADLTCRIVRPDEPMRPEAVVVLCHGFGAPGADLVPLAGEFLRCAPHLKNRVQFVFPEGPRTIPEVPGGRAWWPIDMLEMQMSILEGRFREMRQSVPPLLPDARNRLTRLLEQLQQDTGLPMSQFVIGGFSQGSMLATDVALRLPTAPGALVVYSGTLLAESEWVELAPRRAGLPVLQTHGTQDPILPFEAALWLRDLLMNAGLDVEFQSFSGTHTISGEGVRRAAELIAGLLPAPS
ncbi:MAG: alpha/beta hydrolase [Planctomycetaceae bacterium]